MLLSVPAMVVLPPLGLILLKHIWHAAREVGAAFVIYPVVVGVPQRPAQTLTFVALSVARLVGHQVISDLVLLSSSSRHSNAKNCR